MRDLNFDFFFFVRRFWLESPGFRMWFTRNERKKNCVYHEQRKIKDQNGYENTDSMMNLIVKKNLERSLTKHNPEKCILVFFFFFFSFFPLIFITFTNLVPNSLLSPGSSYWFLGVLKFLVSRRRYKKWLFWNLNIFDGYKLRCSWWFLLMLISSCYFIFFSV